MFAKLKLRQRILLGYLAPLLLLIIVMTYVFDSLEVALSASEQLERFNRIEDGAYQIQIHAASLERATRGYMLTKSPLTRRYYDIHDKALFDLESLSQLVRDSQQLETLRRVQDLSSELRELNRQEIDLVDAGKPEEAIALFRAGTLLKKTDEMERLSGRFLQRASELHQEQRAKLLNALDQVRMAIIAGTAAATVIAIGIGWWLALALSRRISAYAVQLASATSEIAATVTQHESTASRQAAAASETASTIEELSSSSRQSAEQAANAAVLAGDASRSTGEGSATTGQAIAAMSALKEKINLMADHILRLSEQSGQIGSIAGLVKDLAGEINMLALNAAVEATRAGEHGKGFSVVASEVRKLADQSKKSAEQTTALIVEIQKATNSSIMMTEDSARMVTDVTRQAEEVGALFKQLTGMAANVSVNVQQVMLNAKQQATAFNQVVEATSSISAGAKETAAGISQTKLAVEQLNLAVQNLRALA
jgi:methyl-accepting chemotaxis protein